MASSSKQFLYYLSLSAFLVISNYAGTSKAWYLDDGEGGDSNSGMEYYFPSPPPPPPSMEERHRCEDVRCRFPSCLDYLSGAEDSPSLTCCTNLEALNCIAREEGPRRICQCIEDLRPSLLESRIRGIYKECGIHLSFPISQHMDCSSV
ncbi:unnamed protein product [Cuscuta epithymum]|uniref:Bifunctional inhibitor/plant lipid transfer protein/seed storage helical domain-containing protein n=1 Tax=Cuscuta epithymum TaxID=186058 RepID=A0AAV0EU93_9ASTE|nr:unnamed protein product [Cuscuta epithymum]